MDNQLNSFFKHIIHETDQYIKLKNHNELNSYIEQLLIKNITKNNNKFYFYQILSEISNEKNVFKLKRLNTILAEESLLKIGIFNHTIKKELNNESYYKNLSYLGFSNLNQMTNKNYIYKLILEELNSIIIKLNIISINLFHNEHNILDLYLNYMKTKNLFYKHKLNKLGIFPNF